MNRNYHRLHFHRISIGLVLLLFTGIDIDIVFPQSNVTIAKTRIIAVNTRAIISDGDLKGYWNNQQIIFNSNEIQLTENESVLNVLPYSTSGELDLLTISKIFSKQTQTTKINYRIINSHGTIFSQWTENYTYDTGVPYTFIAADGTIFLLSTETQSYRCFSSAGEKIVQHSLFEKSPWSHEKSMLIGESPNGIPYIVGMESPSLTTSENVMLFQLDQHLKPEQKIPIPLTIPYHFQISQAGIIAVLGTRSVAGSYEQEVLLYFLNDRREYIKPPQRLSTVPKLMQWNRNYLVLVYRHQVMIVTVDGAFTQTRFDFRTTIIPIGLFFAEESVWIIASKGIQAESSGFSYQGIILIEYNLSTEAGQRHELTTANHSIVKVFPNPRSNEITLQLDQQVIKYKLD